MKNKLLIVSDSLALPRLTPEITAYEDTYPYKLKQEFEVMQFSKGGGIIPDLFMQIEYFEAFDPDIVVLQSGIVDCAPRAFPLWMERGRMKKLASLIAFFISPRKLRDWFSFKWTSDTTYRTFCMMFKQRLPHAKFIAVGILPASQEYENKVRGISEGIKKYNSILSDVFGDGYIDMSGIPADCVMSDFHHLNKNGHEFVFNKILKKIAEL